MKDRFKHQAVTNTAVFLAVLFVCNAGLHAQSVKSGSWTRKNYGAEGKWEIVKNDSAYTLVLSGFKTKKAPDLKLIAPARHSHHRGQRHQGHSFDRAAQVAQR